MRQQFQQPRPYPPCVDCRKPVAQENAVLIFERHHVGNGGKRDQLQLPLFRLLVHGELRGKLLVHVRDENIIEAFDFRRLGGIVPRDF